MSDGRDEALRLVCTDKGRHKSRELGVVLWDSETDLVVEVQLEGRSRPTAGLTVMRDVTVHGKPASSLDTRRLKFNCPSCPRNIPFQQETLQKLFRAVAEQGRFDGDARVVRIDISNM